MRNEWAGASQTVRSFWHGSTPNAYLLSGLRSFVDYGHRVEVFTYDETIALPDWIHRRDAAEVLPTERVMSYGSGPGRGSFALHSNVFRYALLHRFGGWWIDLDVVALKPVLPEGEIFFARCDDHLVCTGVIKFPPGHPVIRAALESSASVGESVSDWGETGPRLFTDLVEKHSLRRFEAPRTSAYPIRSSDTVALFDPSRREEMKMRCEGASFLHLYNEVWRRAGIPTYLGPPAGSYLDWLLAKHLPEVRFAAALQLEHIAAWLRNSDRSIACDHLELKYQALLSANNPLSALPLDPKSLSIRRTVDHDMLRQMTNEGRYEVALRLALEARNRDINDAEAHFRIGQCLFSDGGDADQGIAALDAAEQLGFAERFWLLFFRGALYARQGKTESALKDLNEAVSLDPTHVEAANLRRAMHQVQQQSGG